MFSPIRSLPSVKSSGCECFRFGNAGDELAHADGGLFFAGHFNTHRALAGDRRFDTDVLSSQRHLDVVLQIHERVDANALSGNDFKIR